MKLTELEAMYNEALDANHVSISVEEAFDKFEAFWQALHKCLPHMFEMLKAMGVHQIEMREDVRQN